MTTLKHTPAAGQALYRRKVEERAQIVRGRVEAMPGAGQQAKMDSVDNRIRLAHLSVAMDLMDQIDGALERHRQALVDAEIAAAGQAQDQLLAERGIETETVGVVRSRDGWVWLTTRKPARLSADQIATGNQYQALYAAAHRDTLSTSANDNACGDLTVAQIKASMEARHTMRLKLAAVRAHIAGATGSDRLAGLLEAVCGHGQMLRHLAGSDDRKAATYEVELRLALDMAAVAFKIAGKREGAV